MLQTGGFGGPGDEGGEVLTGGDVVVDAGGVETGGGIGVVVGEELGTEEGEHRACRRLCWRAPTTLRKRRVTKRVTMYFKCCIFSQFSGLFNLSFYIQSLSRCWVCDFHPVFVQRVSFTVCYGYTSALPLI